MLKNVLKRKEKIIITAIDLLDEAGINGLTTKEIARRQEISEPAVYKQFDSKRDIVIEILNRYATFDNVIKNTIIDNYIEGRAAIFYFVNAYTEYYQNYPQITTVMFSFDVFRYQQELNEKMCSIVSERYDTLCKIISKAIDKGELAPDTDCDALVDIIFGILWSNTFVWKMSNCNFNLKERTIKALEALM